MLAGDVQAFTVEGDMIFLAADGRLSAAKIPVYDAYGEKGMKPLKLQVLAKGVYTEKMAADESSIYYFLWSLGGGSVQRISRKGGKPQTVCDEGVFSIWQDHGKVYALTYQYALLSLTGTCH